MYEPGDLRRNSQMATGTAGDAQAPAAMHELLTLVERLDNIVSAETAALAEHRAGDLAVFTRKKSQILLEVTRLTRQMKLPTGDARLNSRLKELKRSLEHNRHTLDLHLRAASQLTSIISDAVRATESDGTYAAPGAAGRFGG